jgi:hypothetical protein
MDIQLTDFENSALTIMVGMIANVVNYFDIDFVLPISLVDENMLRAHEIDALTQTKFWWKTGGVRLNENGRPTKADLEKTDFLKSNPDFKRPESQDTTKNTEQHLYKQVFIRQILEGDAKEGIEVGLIDLSFEFMRANAWSDQA